ncbi:MAG: hypothetical protein ACERKN_19555 [Velocimicrobium sp.]
MAELKKEEKVQLLEEQELYGRKEFLDIISRIILQYSECMDKGSIDKGGKLV